MLSVLYYQYNVGEGGHILARAEEKVGARMTESKDNNRLQMQSEDAIRVLELFSGAAQITFDRILAARVLGEAERAISGDDWQSWSHRLIEAGESLSLRIHSTELSLEDALTFVQQGVPVAACIEEADGDLTWVLISGARGRKVRIVSDRITQSDSWVKISTLRKLLQISKKSATTRWLVGQPALACEPPSSHQGQDKDHEHQHLSPLLRLIGLLRPERSDLWVILVFSLVVGILALATPIAVEALVNTVAFGRYLQPVIVLAILLFVFLAFAAAIRALITFLVEMVQRRLFVRVVEDLAYRLPRVRQQSLDKEYGPELVNRFFDIVTLQKSVAGLLLEGISIALQTVIGMSVLAFYHPFFLGFDVLLLTLIALIVFGLGRGAVKTAIQESKAKYAVAAWLEELVRHPTAFKFHAGTQFALDRADQLAIHWLEARRGHFHVLMRQILFTLGLQALAATALLGLGGWLVIQGQLTLGQLVAAELIVMIIVGSFAKLMKLVDSFYDLLASVDKLGHLFDLPTVRHDKLLHLREQSPASIHLHNVSFSYDTLPVLEDLNLQVHPGESLALVGAPGTGKSTIVDMLCGIRQPTAGRVELDGIDLRELRADSLHDHVAVARSIEIFHGSIDENVHLNRSNISSLDVREALAAVGLLEELLKLPDGLNTLLQTNGSPLSSMQAVRLMLARAIVGRPRLLLIDGTLDPLSDEMIADLLESLARDSRRPWTLLITTGRQAIKDACQRVLNLNTSSVESRGK